MLFARKRWGKGRTRQVLVGAWCWVAGHRWGRAFDDGDGSVTRRCLRGCGALHVGFSSRGPRRPV